MEDRDEANCWDTHSVEEIMAEFAEPAPGSIDSVCLCEYAAHCGAPLHGTRVWTQAHGAHESVAAVHGLRCAINHYHQSTP